MDDRTLIEKLQAMAEQVASPEEAAIAKVKLEAKLATSGGGAGVPPQRPPAAPAPAPEPSTGAVFYTFSYSVGLGNSAGSNFAIFFGPRNGTTNTGGW